MISRHGLQPQSVAEVGCGAGEILRQLQLRLPESCSFFGFDVSPHAIKLCSQRANERLSFRLIDARADALGTFDLLLIIDLIEHLENPYAFLRSARTLAPRAIFHIPLDLSAQTVLRSTPILGNRAVAGHIQYFTKDLALATLRESGFLVRDWIYTTGGIDLPSETLKMSLALRPRRWLFRLSQEAAVRILGGFSLLVLADSSAADDTSPETPSGA